MPLVGHIYTFETAVSKYLKPVEIRYPTSNLKPIDCVFVINLDRRTERWRRAEMLCQEQGLLVNRVSAVDGSLLTDEAMTELMSPYSRRLHKGAVGCLLSHVSILKEAYKRGCEVIWILEDDFEIVGDIHRLPRIVERLSAIDPDWDIFYTDPDGKNIESGNYVPSLGSDFRPDHTAHPPLSYYLTRTPIDEEILRIGQRFCTHSMLYSRKGIEKALHYFTHVYVYSPIDIDIHYIPGIRQYAAATDLVSSRPGPSDTGWCSAGSEDTQASAPSGSYPSS